MASAKVWSLYVIVAGDSRSESFFKIGISSAVDKRAAQLQTECPIPLKEVLVVKLWSMAAARSAEQAMHQKLEAFRSHGEWFRFDLTDPAHKVAFNEAARETLDLWAGAGWKWSRANLQAVRVAAKQLAECRAAQKRESKRRTRSQAVSGLRQASKKVA